MKNDKFIFNTIINEMWESWEIYSNQDNRDDWLRWEWYYYDAIVKVWDKEFIFTQENYFETWPDIYEEYSKIERQIEMLKEKKKLMDSLYLQYKWFKITVKDCIAKEYIINIWNVSEWNVKEIYIDYDELYDYEKEEAKTFIELHKWKQEIFLI